MGNAMSQLVTLRDLVTNESIEFNSGNADAHGSVAWFDKWEGWDGPSGSMSTLQPTAHDGVEVTGERYGERPLVIGGIFTTTSAAGAWGTYNAALRLLRKGNVCEMTVSEAGNIKGLMVRRAAAPRLQMRPGSIEFMFTLMAPNPYKFGGVQSIVVPAGGQVTITNTGTAATPYWQMQAAGTGRFAMRIGQRLMTTDQTSVANAVLDRDIKTFTSNGVNRYGALATTFGWAALEPGTNQVFNTGDTPVTVSWRDAWE